MASPIPTEKRVRVICKSQNEGRGHNPSTESKCMSDMPPTTMVAEFCRSLSGRCSRDRKSVSRSSNEAPPNFWGELNRKCLLQIGRTMKVIRTVRHRARSLLLTRRRLHTEAPRPGPASPYNRTRSPRAEPERVAKLPKPIATNAHLGHKADWAGTCGARCFFTSS